ncbi:MAG: arginase family protein [Bacteroidetes bacterium]|nr:arginase family protein [Bacteroidota bacterium]
MSQLKVYNKSDVLSLTKIRKFETRLGEEILTAADPNNIAASIEKSPAEYVLFGIPEDIGVRASEGQGGGEPAWVSFLSNFLNIQSNDFLVGSNILLLGHLDFRDLAQLIEANASDPEEKLMAYRHAVHTIDEAVEPLIRIITAAGKIPIVIAGGHNNAYPLIKGAAKGLNKAGLIPLPQINAVNLDAHPEFSPIEGRHSANGFRYAEEDGFLEKYCVIGVHENNIPQNVWLDIRNNPFTDLITYEDIFVLEKRNFAQAVAHATGYTEDNYIGLELDLDAIAQVPGAGLPPSGLTPLHARQYVTFAAIDSRIAYLHICEGAVCVGNGCSNPSTGRLISYIVSDFLKARE